MIRIRVLAVIAAAAFLAAVPIAAAGGGKTADAIWINVPGLSASASSVTLQYGQTFTASFTSKAAYPWGHAQCVDSTGTAFWGEWRALQADGTIGVFDLTTVNSGVAWPAAGAYCTLDLVSTQPKYTVLATATFYVTAS